MIAIFDTETTGLLKPEPTPLAQQPEIIEVAVMVMASDGAELNRYTSLVKPRILPLLPKITEITGIRTEDLKDAPPFSAVLPRLQGMFLGIETMIAHNLAYDRGMLTLELRRLDAMARFPWPPDHICTVERCAPFMPGGKWPKQHELYSFLFNKPIPEGSHRAMNDVERLADIVRELLRRKIL